MDIDVDQLIVEIKDVASEVLKSDIAQVRGFSERQVEAISLQAAYVAAGIATGQVTDETRDFFLDGIEDMVKSFLNTLRGLAFVTVEKLWNAVVKVVWKAISSAAGVTLPLPIND